MQDKLIKIAVVGPESTGKSSVAARLAKHFCTVCVPEYAREYCKGLDRHYTLQDELNIFYGQVALEKSLEPLAQGNMLVCDTMFLTVKIWCDHLFAHTPEVVLEAVKQSSYDFFLLMDIDLPWEDDPLRDFPEDREYFMEVWHRELRAMGAAYKLIGGLGEQRYENAIHAVNHFMNE